MKPLITSLLLSGILFFSSCSKDKTDSLSPIPSTAENQLSQSKAKDNSVNCLTIYDPVCSCNNKTYSNSCFAESAGITCYKKGACKWENGTLVGTFYRSGPGIKYNASVVTIKFNNNTFEGSSTIENYPAICKGTFKISGQEVEFFNSCMWTANFDWSFILSGKYKFNISNGKLLMARSYPNSVSDTYQLSLVAATIN